MTIAKITYLAKVNFLSGLTAQELNELAADFVWQEYAPGTDMVKQGQDPQSFYVLAEGRAEVLITQKGQNSWPVNTFGPGDAFGEIALFTAQPAPTTIRCSEYCRVLVLDAEHFALMLLRWPKLYQQFVEKLSQSLNKANNVLWEAKHKEFLRSALQLTQYEEKFYGIWGSIRTTREVENKLNELSGLKDNLLLIGERGTGRQMMAWYLHKLRFGESAPFIVIEGRNFERQWGNRIVQGSESDTPSPGGGTLLDIVDGGTLLIREVNLISPRSQQELARYLNCHRRDCLLIGSLQNKAELLTQPLTPELLQCFKQTYEITPLRERKRDIPVLVQGILEKLAQKHNRKTPILDPEATKLLLSHNYRQGNVTELIQVVERAFFLAENDLISLEHIFFGPTAKQMGRTTDLLAWPFLSNILKKGTVVRYLQRGSAAIFMLIILLLLLAPASAAGKNIFNLVWGLWWLGLVIISPFLGRVWCTVCPFAYIMDFVQKRFHLNRPVPDFLKKYDYILVTLLFLVIFWTELVTDMRNSTLATVLLLLSIQLAAVAFGVIFTRHTWCSHLCPLGGFIGMAAMGSMLEVRADAAVCLNKCTSLDCYKGSSKAPGCPMSQHLPYLDNNLACKLCFNCVRNCPNSAVQFNLRFFGREVWHIVRANQGFAILPVVTLALLLPVDYFEPLFRSWPLAKWRLWFSLAYWGTALAAALITWFLAKPFKTKAASRRIKLVFAFIPLVLSGHIIYRLQFLHGIDSLLLGAGFKSGGQVQSLYIPAHTALVGAVALIGLLLTVFSVGMVLWRTKSSKHLTTSHEPALPGNQSSNQSL